MSADERRLFAIIPAAGRSRRMGQPKLLLPFGDTTVIGHLIRVLRVEKLAAITVLVRLDDAPLAEEVRKHGATAVQPETAPPEMRVSVELLLGAVESRYSPTSEDGWLLIPGDHPLLRPETLRRLMAEWHARPDSIILPVTEGRRGHPAIFPWACAQRVRDMPPDVGVNHLLRCGDAPIVEIAVDDPTVLLDLDVPSDYELSVRMLEEHRS